MELTRDLADEAIEAKAPRASAAKLVVDSSVWFEEPLFLTKEGMVLAHESLLFLFSQIFMRGPHIDPLAFTNARVQKNLLLSTPYNTIFINKNRAVQLISKCEKKYVTDILTHKYNHICITYIYGLGLSQRLTAYN
jgi:hypothetical protein